MRGARSRGLQRGRFSTGPVFPATASQTDGGGKDVGGGLSNITPVCIDTHSEKNGSDISSGQHAKFYLEFWVLCWK